MSMLISVLSLFFLSALVFEILHSYYPGQLKASLARKIRPAPRGKKMLLSFSSCPPPPILSCLSLFSVRFSSQLIYNPSKRIYNLSEYSLEYDTR